MKVRAIRSFIDKYSIKSISKGKIIEITEERFSELTAGPRGVFVEEIKEELSFENLTKSELVEFGKKENIELSMKMNKNEMIEILLKK